MTTDKRQRAKEIEASISYRKLLQVCCDDKGYAEHRGRTTSEEVQYEAMKTAVANNNLNPAFISLAIEYGLLTK